MVVFTESQNRAMDSFVEGLAGDGPRCLWVCGARRSGTSTFAREVVDRVYVSGNFDQTMPEGRLITALDLSDLRRRVWTQEELMRANGSDLSLWQETQALLDRWDGVWNANVLMVDDIIQVDVEFWKRHLLARLDQRLKGPGVTLIAGVTPPALFGAEWSPALGSLCRVITVGD